VKVIEGHKFNSKNHGSGIQVHCNVSGTYLFDGIDFYLEAGLQYGSMRFMSVTNADGSALQDNSLVITTERG